MLLVSCERCDGWLLYNQLKFETGKVDYGNDRQAHLGSPMKSVLSCGFIKGADSVELETRRPWATGHVEAVELVSTRSTVRSARSSSSTRRTCANKAGRCRSRPARPAKGDDSVVKLRPGRPGRAAELRSRQLRRRGRRHARGVRLLGIHEDMLGRRDVKDAVAGKRALRPALLQGAAIAYAAHAPDGLEVDDSRSSARSWCSS